jgi:hypothetical protein
MVRFKAKYSFRGSSRGTPYREVPASLNRESSIMRRLYCHRKLAKNGWSRMGGRGHREGATADSKALFERFDKNQDGKLDFDELAAASGQDKAAIKIVAGLFDLDADGTLNQGEFAAAVNKLRK